MPKRAQLLAPEHQAYVTDRYLAADVPPRELVRELAENFNVIVKPAQLRQWLTRSGLGRQKAAVDAKTRSIVSAAKVDGIARAKSAAPAQLLAGWAEKSVTVADKAMSLAEHSERPRDVASAISAAGSAIKIFRLCSGIDGPESAPRGAIKFDFNFGNMVLRVGPQTESDAPSGPRRYYQPGEPRSLR